MTGFGRAVVELTNKKITVEIKSLNSKQLDLSLRVPAALRDEEMALRNLVSHRLERGKVELSMYVENQQGDSSVQLNIATMAAYKQQFEQMRRELDLPEPSDWYSLLLRFPDSVKTDVVSGTSDEEAEGARRAVELATDALMDFRAKEGAKLEEFFKARIDRISELLAEIPQYEVERVAHIRARIIDNLGKLPKVEYDRGRLEQEMIFYIEKLDINEEKQRLAQHLRYFLETLDGEAGQGKKLGFIAQEMGREINTLGSKSNQADMQILVVKMKDELEQIKEQVLNVL